MENKKPVAVFDIDGTVYRSNLLVDTVDAFVEHGIFPRKIKKQFTEEYYSWREQRHRDSYVKYIDRLVTTYISYIKGVSEDEMQEVVSSVIESAHQQLYVYSRELIQKIKPTHFLLAISGSPSELVGPFSKSLGFDDFHASTYEVVDGIYTGIAVAGHHNKDQTLKNKVLKHALTFEGSIGMGDTDADIPMLELVEYPIAFNPNKELLHKGLEEEWEIISEHKDTIFHMNKGRFELVGDFGHYYSE